LSAACPSVRRYTPDAGEHTDEVLAEFGYENKEIAELRAKGII
jgi:formyl-CoA transferase/CoA:oxalate CoA-transferase